MGGQVVKFVWFVNNCGGCWGVCTVYCIGAWGPGVVRVHGTLLSSTLGSCYEGLSVNAHVPRLPRYEP